MVSTISRSDPERTQRGIELEGEPLVPDRIGGELVVEPELPGRHVLQPVGEPEEQRIGGPAGIADRRQQPLLQQVEAGPAQQIVPALQLVRQGRSQAPAVPLEPVEQPPHRPAA